MLSGLRAICRPKVRRTFTALLGATISLAAVARVSAQVDTLPSDLPSHYVPPAREQDYVRRDVMIPMRDGVRLHTVILMKKGLSRAPILLERTPYGAGERAVRGTGDRLADIVPPADAPYVEDGYIRVWQDVRGRYGSEGTYVTNRPLAGALNPTGIDHATDTSDTIDWLVRNLPESNGRVGVIGGSYDGFLALMATLSGNPALRAAVPINPMVDVWMGDDWFHRGAFRPITLNVLPSIMAAKGKGVGLAGSGVDLYDLMLATGSTGDYIRRFDLEAFPLVQRFLAHPAYDGEWQARALDQALAEHPITTPMLLVGGQFDEQDQYGAPAVFEALHPLDRAGRVSLLFGPWPHMGIEEDGSSLGALRFGEDTAARARREIIKPFLDAHLKDRAAPVSLPPVISYATGADRWHAAGGFARPSATFYLRSAGMLADQPAPPADASHDDYLADPAHPVPVAAEEPFLMRGGAWKTMLVADQRFASRRPDVLTYMSTPIDRPAHIFGHPRADLFAATTGTDGDVVVKLIDVYPADDADPAMRGFELPVSMDILRERYRRDPAVAAPLVPGAIEHLTVELPVADHVFGRGHRIMVQIQSSWFPMYDRNPQRFVPSIFAATPSDYVKATQSIYHDSAHRSAITLPVVPTL